MNHSQVMGIAQEMTDGLGPRLTNSPGMRRAEQWAIDKFNGWGLANVHRDGFEFGRGWEIVLVSARMMSPRPLELTAIPVAWTPPTNGAVSAPIVVAPMTKEEHFAAWKGKLEIGRASCRERVCPYVEISVDAVYLKKKQAKK